MNGRRSRRNLVKPWIDQVSLFERKWSECMPRQKCVASYPFCIQPWNNCIMVCYQSLSAILSLNQHGNYLNLLNKEPTQSSFCIVSFWDITKKKLSTIGMCIPDREISNKIIQNNLFKHKFQKPKFCYYCANCIRRNSLPPPPPSLPLPLHHPPHTVHRCIHEWNSIRLCTELDRDGERWPLFRSHTIEVKTRVTRR